MSEPLCKDCGYAAWTISAETGQVLYCAVCNARNRARDAETSEKHCKQQLEQANAECERLREGLRIMGAGGRAPFSHGGFTLAGFESESNRLLATDLRKDQP